MNHKQVELRGGFWGPRLKTHCEVTVPHALDCLERDGHVTNFDKAAGRFDGPLRGHHAFDSDLHKALEGAIDRCSTTTTPDLRQRVDGMLDRILAAQQKDGFLISYFIVQGLDKKWEDLRLEHQMYNAGHFFEMAVEHDRVDRGNPKVLDAAKAVCRPHRRSLRPRQTLRRGRARGSRIGAGQAVSRYAASGDTWIWRSSFSTSAAMSMARSESRSIRKPSSSRPNPRSR